MPPHTTPPDPDAPVVSPGTTTKSQAERHEALWLSLAALHKDTVALGTKKPDAPVSESLRISAENLLSDCAPFTRRRGERLPPASSKNRFAPHLLSSGGAIRIAAVVTRRNWRRHGRVAKISPCSRHLYRSQCTHTFSA